MVFLHAVQIRIDLLFTIYALLPLFRPLFCNWIQAISIKSFILRKKINCLCEHNFFFIGWTDFFIKKKNILFMFQIKLTKPIKPSRSNYIAIGRKTDPNRYASVLIITKPILINSVSNLKKNQADRTAHTPNSNDLPLDW